MHKLGTGSFQNKQTPSTNSKQQSHTSAVDSIQSVLSMCRCCDRQNWPNVNTENEKHILRYRGKLLHVNMIASQLRFVSCECKKWK